MLFCINFFALSIWSRTQGGTSASVFGTEATMIERPPPLELLAELPYHILSGIPFGSSTICLPRGKKRGRGRRDIRHLLSTLIYPTRCKKGLAVQCISGPAGTPIASLFSCFPSFSFSIRTPRSGEYIGLRPAALGIAPARLIHI